MSFFSVVAVTSIVSSPRHGVLTGAPSGSESPQVTEIRGSGNRGYGGMNSNPALPNFAAMQNRVEFMAPRSQTLSIALYLADGIFKVLRLSVSLLEGVLSNHSGEAPDEDRQECANRWFPPAESLSVDTQQDTIATEYWFEIGDGLTLALGWR
ncbi:hypothetical protein [Corynebacterium sp. A21]|uniref:hypothetical protein n=1 Tax=Corynebacterium sp. A21 TaxID=3457318 RepID=UPI003FD1216A